MLEPEDYTLTVTDSWWNDSPLILQYSVEASAKPDDNPGGLTAYSGLNQFTVEEPGNPIPLGNGSHHVDRRYAGTRWYALVDLSEGTGDTLGLRLMGAASPITPTLRRAEGEVSFDQAGYYNLTEHQGGPLAIPRLENGELSVSIYLLNEEASPLARG